MVPVRPVSIPLHVCVDSARRQDGDASTFATGQFQRSIRVASSGSSRNYRSIFAQTAIGIGSYKMEIFLHKSATPRQLLSRTRS